MRATSRDGAIVGPVFALTALQMRAARGRTRRSLAIGAAAVLAGFSFSYGDGDLGDRASSRRCPARSSARVSAYSWMASDDLPAAGYAIAGWVANVHRQRRRICSIGAIWIVVTTVIVVSVRDVRDFRLRPGLQEPDFAASVPAS